jgi:hypothetical protein
MKLKEINRGWVIASMNGKFILPYTFERKRIDSIEKWIKLWNNERYSWQKFKRKGYKCIRAKQTTEIE